MRACATRSRSSKPIRICSGVMNTSGRTWKSYLRHALMSSIDIELKHGKKMSTPGRFIILVLSIVIAAAAFMAPRRDEWLAMMSDDKKHSQIIALLEPKLERSPNDTAVLATLGRSYAEIGNTTRAIELFERYISLRHDDGDAYGYLADLYGASGERAKRITMLRQSVDLAPKLSRVAELADAYREDGRSRDEVA